MKNQLLTRTMFTSDSGTMPGKAVRLKRKAYGTVLACCILLSFSAEPVFSQGSNEWPCFHGPARDNKSPETGLLKQWPDTGPKLLWTASGLDEGYSSVSIADGMIFTAGKFEKQTYVYAFDMNGGLKWRKPNGPAWKTLMPWAISYPGPRSTPTCDSGVVYHLGEMGRLAAFDVADGREIWFVDLRETYDAEVPEYGYAESVYIRDNRLYVSPAGKKGFLVCLNKKDGSLIWANTSIPGQAAYSSQVPAVFNGIDMLLGMSSSCVYGVDADTGKLIFNVAFEGKLSLNCTDPIYHDSHVFVTSGYGKGSMLLKLKASGASIVAETVWQVPLMDNHHGGVILHEGCLYGSGSEARGWFCLDFATGKELWKTRGKGSLTFADSMLYCLDENGVMRLVTATPKGYDERSTFKAIDGGKGMHWAHPVVCGKRLYLRHTDKLSVFDISGG